MMPTREEKAPPAPIAPPRQKRSQETLKALLRASERLLETRSFADVTIGSIIREAGSSSGSFYARFADKSALLHALHERFADRARQEVRRLVARIDPTALRFDEVTLILMKELVLTHTANRGVLRAALMEGLVDERFAHRVLGLIRDVADTITPLLQACRPPRDCTTTRIETGLRTVLAVLDQNLFLGALTSQDDVSPRTMRDPEWLNRIFLASIEE